MRTSCEDKNKFRKDLGIFDGIFDISHMHMQEFHRNTQDSKIIVKDSQIFVQLTSSFSSFNPLRILRHLKLCRHRNGMYSRKSDV